MSVRVAFILPDGKTWTGGRYYFLNLFRALDMFGDGKITPVVFFDPASHQEGMGGFSDINIVEAVACPGMDRTLNFKGILTSILWGRHPRLWRMIREYGVDVVFEAAWFHGWRPGVPVLAWIPDFQHRFLRDMFSPFSWWKRELGYRLQAGTKRTILLSSEDAKKSCESFYPCARGKTRVVRFAVPPVRIDTAEADQVRRQYGLPEHFFYLPNQFWRHKNHMLVLDALCEIKKKGTQIVVASSGNPSDFRDPTYFPKLEAKVKDCGLSDMFRLLGLIPYPHVTFLMRAASALLNPSLFEGWSTTVEEAKSMGTPMILSDLEVHKEQAGDNAVYFDRHSPSGLADALLEFVPLDFGEREKQAEVAAEVALQRVEKFARDFLLVIEEMVCHAD